MNHEIIALLAYLTQTMGGSLGLAIVTLSLGIRIALMPLTIKLARRARRNQEVMRLLQPEIEQLKKRFEKKPELLFGEISKLYRKHGCSPLDVPALLASLVQLPIFGLLYSAIRSSVSASGAFLWMKNLATPDFALTLAIVSISAISAYLMPSASEQMRGVIVMIQVVMTFLIVWKLAAGLGLYWASSSAVGLFQTVWLRYRVDTGVQKSRP